MNEIRKVSAWLYPERKELYGTLLPNELPYELTDEPEVRRALANPISSPRLSELVSPGERVVIVTSDITRPIPSYRVLPEVIAELVRGGVAERDITVILALEAIESIRRKKRKPWSAHLFIKVRLKSLTVI